MIKKAAESPVMTMVIRVSIIVIAAVLIGVGTQYGETKDKVEAHERELPQLCDEMTDLKATHEKDMGELDVKIEDMDDKLDTIQRNQAVQTTWMQMLLDNEGIHVNLPVNGGD